MSCIKCGRKKFLTAQFCREHWNYINQNDHQFSKFKELYFRDFIFQYLSEVFNTQVQWNRRLHGTTFRPDFQFVNYHGRLVIIEIDEFMHFNYELDENRDNKILDLYPNCRIIRINTDEYINLKKAKLPAIWTKIKSLDKINQQVIIKIITNENELLRRIEIVKDLIINSFDPTSAPGIIHLFYNNTSV